MIWSWPAAQMRPIQAASHLHLVETKSTSINKENVHPQTKHTSSNKIHLIVGETRDPPQINHKNSWLEVPAAWNPHELPGKRMTFKIFVMLYLSSEAKILQALGMQKLFQFCDNCRLLEAALHNFPHTNFLSASKLRRQLRRDFPFCFGEQNM